MDASYSTRNSDNFATQSAPVSISNLLLLRDKFDELVGRLQEETQARRLLAQQLVDEKSFRAELVQAEAKQHANGHSEERAVQLAKVVSNLRLKLRQAQEKVEHLEYGAALSQSPSAPDNRRGGGGGRGGGGNVDAETALAFHNQKLKTRVAELEAQLKMAKIVAAEKVEVAEGQAAHLAALEKRLDDLTLGNDRLLDKSRSLLGKYRHSLGQMRDLKAQGAAADHRAEKADSRAEGLAQRMTTLRRLNQSLTRTVDEKELEIEQERFALERNEHKHQEVRVRAAAELLLEVVRASVSCRALYCRAGPCTAVDGTLPFGGVAFGRALRRCCRKQTRWPCTAGLANRVPGIHAIVFSRVISAQCRCWLTCIPSWTRSCPRTVPCSTASLLPAMR